MKVLMVVLILSGWVGFATFKTYQGITDFLNSAEQRIREDCRRKIDDHLKSLNSQLATIHHQLDTKFENRVSEKVEELLNKNKEVSQ